MVSLYITVSDVPQTTPLVQDTVSTPIDTSIEETETPTVESPIIVSDEPTSTSQTNYVEESDTYYDSDSSDSSYEDESYNMDYSTTSDDISVDDSIETPWAELETEALNVYLYSGSTDPTASSTSSNESEEEGVYGEVVDSESGLDNLVIPLGILLGSLGLGIAISSKSNKKV